LGKVLKWENRSTSHLHAPYVAILTFGEKFVSPIALAALDGRRDEPL
jgi:hypothetical protein